MGNKKWPALVISVDETQVLHCEASLCMQNSRACHHTMMHALVLVMLQIGQQPVQVRVQLFATGIKTAVKLSTVCHLESTDGPADDSALARKVNDQPSPATCTMHGASRFGAKHMHPSAPRVKRQDMRPAAEAYLKLTPRHASLSRPLLRRKCI
jgi:hypothetical protein